MDSKENIFSAVSQDEVAANLILDAVKSKNYAIIDNRANEDVAFRYSYCKTALAVMFTQEVAAEVSKPLFERVKKFYPQTDRTLAAEKADKEELEAVRILMCMASILPETIPGIEGDDALAKKAVETCVEMAKSKDTLNPKNFEFLRGCAMVLGSGIKKDRKGGLAIMKQTASATTFNGEQVLKAVTSKKPLYIRIPKFIIKFIVGYIAAMFVMVPYAIVGGVFMIIGMFIPSAKYTAKNIENSLKRVYSAIWQWIKR